MASTATRLNVVSRAPEGSRAVRRLRRTGRVPGVIYGGGENPLSFDVDERELRHALAARGAVLDVSIDGGAPSPAVLKETQRHPVRGQTTHVDLLRVRLDKPIQAMVTLELVGGEDAPGAKEGGVLEHVTREVSIEALPTAIPESIPLDVSAMQVNDTLTLAAVVPPAGVTLLDDPETTLATLTPPRLQTEEGDEIEAETELVGEGEGEGAEGEADASAEGEASADGDDASD
ncbi:MAG TPA: 50S ribosomal protein L25 [Solirubrobacteraceae bacterium]|jgi:large subunit ribosomal protein L25|nr:50S ribosomal protein L25 [Solirubrobacteraceae bacterium]